MNVLLFGITRNIAGKSSLAISNDDLTDYNITTVDSLKKYLMHKYPEFNKLTSLGVAVNNNYVTNDTALTGSEEIALIPPVSGG